MNTTAENPLIIRYPLSKSEVIIRCNFSTCWFKKRFPQDSGLWYILHDVAKKKFEYLTVGDPSYYFVYNEDKKKNGDEEIDNEFAFNKIIEDIELTGNCKREINISIRIKGLL